MIKYGINFILINIIDNVAIDHSKDIVRESQFYSGKIHGFPKMFLHNREDLANFDRVLEISSFHGEKSVNFSFKLLFFKDFTKYNHLKFRCLTV